MLVEKSLYDEFVAAVRRRRRRVKMGDPLDAETQIGSLISLAHRDRVHGFVEGAPGGRRGPLGGKPGGPAPSTRRP